MCLVKISYLENSILVDECGRTFLFGPNQIYFETDRRGNVIFRNVDDRKVILRAQWRDIEIEGETFGSQELLIKGLDTFAARCFSNRGIVPDPFSLREGQEFYDESGKLIFNYYVGSNRISVDVIPGQFISRDGSIQYPFLTINEAIQFGKTRLENWEASREIEPGTTKVDLTVTMVGPNALTISGQLYEDVVVLNYIDNFRLVGLDSLIISTISVPKLYFDISVTDFTVALKNITFQGSLQSFDLFGLRVSLDSSVLGTIGDGKSIGTRNYNPRSPQSFIKSGNGYLDRLDTVKITNILFSINNSSNFPGDYTLINGNVRLSTLMIDRVSFTSLFGNTPVLFGIHPSYVYGNISPRCYITNVETDTLIHTSMTNFHMSDSMKTYVNNSPPQRPDGLGFSIESQEVLPNIYTNWEQPRNVYLNTQSCDVLPVMRIQNAINVIIDNRDYVNGDFVSLSSNSQTHSYIDELDLRVQYNIMIPWTIVNYKNIIFSSVPSVVNKYPTLYKFLYNSGNLYIVHPGYRDLGSIQIYTEKVTGTFIGNYSFLIGNLKTHAIYKSHIDYENFTGYFANITLGSNIYDQNTCL